MRERIKRGVAVCRGFVLALIFLALANALAEPTTRSSSAKIPRSRQAKQSGRQDDSLNSKPADAGTYQQLAYIYAKYLKKTDQAIDYANRAIALNPGDADAYQRLVEIEVAAGQEKKALEVLERATKVRSNDPTFWMQVGKLYVAILFKSDSQPKPDELTKVN